MLVGGLTGMEPYIAICNSVFGACHNVMDFDGSIESDVRGAGAVGEGESSGIAASVVTSQVSTDTSTSTREGGGGRSLPRKKFLSKEKTSSSGGAGAIAAVSPGILYFHDT